MKLFLISQSENADYDTYSDAVVAAPDERTAQYMNPVNGELIVKWKPKNSYCEWASGPQYVSVKLIGTAIKGTKQGVICASYRAG